MEFFNLKRMFFIKSAPGITKNYHEVLLILKILQTKPQVKNMNIKYYDFYFTVNKNRDDNQIVSEEHENNEKDHINYDDSSTPNSYIGRKSDDVMLR